MSVDARVMLLSIKFWRTWHQLARGESDRDNKTSIRYSLSPYPQAQEHAQGDRGQRTVGGKGMGMRGDRHVFLVQLLILQQSGQGFAYLLIVIVGVTFLEEGLIWLALGPGSAWPGCIRD